MNITKRRHGTSTTRRRTRAPLTGHPPLRPVMALHCDRCGHLTPIRLDDWLCRPCQAGGARWAPA